MAGKMETAYSTVIRHSAIIALLILAVRGVSPAQSDRSLIRDGNRMYKQQKFTDAEVNYRKALEQSRTSEQGIFNLGDALYKQNKYEEAAQQYLKSLEQAHDPGVKSQAYHNLGNALLKSQKIPESIASYEEALKLRPNDVDTKYNLAYAKMLLQKQQQQQQKQQNKKDQNKQDQNKQNQQKQDQQKQDQQKQDQQQQEQKQTQKKQQISKEDAERILQALNNEERDVQKKLVKKAPARVRVEKDW